MTPKRHNWDAAAYEYDTILHDTAIHFPALVDVLKKYDLVQKRILDIGSGIGISSRIIAYDVGNDVTGIEISQKMVAIAHATDPYGMIHFHVGDSKKMPVHSEAFDGAVIATVLTNFRKKRHIYKTLKEAWRALQPGGTLVISVPNPHTEGVTYPEARERDFETPFMYEQEGQPYMLRLFRDDKKSLSVMNYHWPQETYEELLGKSGFQLVETQYPLPVYAGMQQEQEHPVYMIMVAVKK